MATYPLFFHFNNNKINQNFHMENYEEVQHLPFQVLPHILLTSGTYMI